MNTILNKGTTSLIYLNYRWATFMLAVFILSNIFTVKAQKADNYIREYSILNSNNATGLPWNDQIGFGKSIAGIGDINADGVPDLAVGHPISTNDTGAVYLLRMSAQGGILSFAMITPLDSNNTSRLDSADAFGAMVVGIGDLDLNGTPDIAVLAPGDDDGANDQGAIYILFLGQNGSVINHAKISNTQGGFSRSNEPNGQLTALGAAGDLNGDGIPDILVSAENVQTSATTAGVTWALLLNRNGSVFAQYSFSANSTWPLNAFYYAGVDRTVDGVENTTYKGKLTSRKNVVDTTGSDGWNDGTATYPGTIDPTSTDPNYIGAVGLVQTTSAPTPMQDPVSSDSCHFGRAVVGIGDIDNDGFGDIAISTTQPRSVIIMALNPLGGIKAWKQIFPSYRPDLYVGTEFGEALASGWDFDESNVNDLLIGDPAYMVNDSTFGAIIQLDPLLDSKATEYSLITKGNINDSTILEIPEGARLGSAIAIWGDVDTDGNAEMVFGIPSNNDVDQRHLLITWMKEHPITLEFVIKDQTPDSLGSVHVNVKGGRPPYFYYWSKELGDPYAFQNTKIGIDTVGLEHLGLTAPIQKILSMNELLSLIEPSLENVKAGIYFIGTKDSKGAYKEETFAIGLKINTLNEVGSNTSTDKKRIKKEAADGWANMQLATKNILPAKEDGWIRFTIPEQGKMLAVGFKDVNTPLTSGYEQMDQAFLFQANKVLFWTGDTLIDRNIHVKDTRTVFQLERKFGAICFIVNGEIKYKLTPDYSKTLTMNVAIYDQGGQVADIATNLRSTFGIAPTIDHLQPMFPGSGSISLALHSGLGPYTATWSNTNSTAPHIDELTPGEYHVSVSSVHFTEPKTKTFLVGSKLIWNEALLEHKEDGIGQILLKKEGGDVKWEEFVLSKNMVRIGAGHQLIFKAYPLDQEQFGTLVGIRSSEDKKIWAGWWVYAFGDKLIAQTVSRTGTAVRTLIKPTDDLEVTLHAYSIHFKKNGEIVHQIPRGTEAESHVIAALHSKGSMIKDLRSTITVPLQINTVMLEPNMQLNCKSPEILITPTISGTKQLMELDASLSVGPYRIIAPATDSTATAALEFKLGNGKPYDLFYATATDTSYLDTALYDFLNNDQLVLYDEPESYREPTQPPFNITLEKGVLLSPNADALYDEFRVTGADPNEGFSLTIRDRQEALLYQTTDSTSGWNGKFMNTGSLVAKGTYKFEIIIGERSYNGQFMVNY